MAPTHKRIATILSVLVLCGCAANAVRVESASSVAETAASVAKDVRAYLGGLADRRREANVALVAAYPGCRWGNDVTILVPDDSSRRPLRCARGLKDRPAHYRAYKISLERIPEEALATAVTQVAVITAYEKALLSAVDKKPSQTFDDLNFAAQAAGVLQANLGKVGLPGNIVSASQIKAAQDLITFVGTLREEAAQAKAVRDTVAREGDKVPEALATLSNGLNALSRLYDVNSADREEAALTSAYLAERDRLSFDERRRFVAAIAAAHDGEADAAARVKLLQNAIGELAKSDRELRNALAGNFSPEQQRQIRELNRKRLLNVVSLLAGLLPG